MPEARLRRFLPALMGSLHQQQADGELVLEQNDGTRRLTWVGGELSYLRSDAGGEQFGNFLIRRGVLDMAALKELLSGGEGFRVGDRLVQLGLMTAEERDRLLHELLSSVLLHAMEHTIVNATWLPGTSIGNLGGDLPFRLDHSRLVWDVFQGATIDKELMLMFASEPDWRWRAIPNLLDTLSNLPLTPTLAYALSLLGNEPMGYKTITSLTGLPEEVVARLVATLWSIGGLTLVEGELPFVHKAEPPPVAPEREAEPELVITLMEEEPQEPTEAPAAPTTSRPMTLMDILEMDNPDPDPDLARDSGSPAGPMPVRNPFSPAGPPPARDPFSPSGPEGAQDSFSASIPLSTRDPFIPEGPEPGRDSLPPPQPVSEPALDPLPPSMLQSNRDAFSASTSFPQPEPMPHPGPSLSLLPNEDNLSPSERARSLVIKAKSYIMQSRTSEATRALEQSIKLDGNSHGAYDAWLLLGRMRLSNPAWSTRAIEALQSAARLNPRAAEPWALMGELYHRKGFQANAQGCFRRALELDPSVAVPAGYDEDEVPDNPTRSAGPGGLLGKLRGMFGRGRG